MSTIDSTIEALATVARRWRDADHPPRAEAREETLRAPNRWSEPALDHALDRWMEQLTPEALGEWLEPSPAGTATVAVLNGEGDPFGGFREALATWALGFDYVGAVSEASPALLPAFASEVSSRLSALEVDFAPVEEAVARADAVIADPIDRVDSVETLCDEAGVPASRRLLRDPTLSVGLVDGHESEDERERLAEDMLLYEGHGPRRLAILWAPREHSPDAYLEAMARFRGLFPAHEKTPGALQMQQAFLEARDAPHAYAEGLEFLVSRGDPAPQKPCHIRWAEYDDLEEVDAWVRERTDLHAVIARRHLHDQCPEDWPLRTPGGVHIPRLRDEEGRRIVAWLREMAEAHYESA